MKKILALFLMLLITLSIFASCNEKIQNEDTQAYTNEQSESLTQTEKQTQKGTTKKETTKKETTKKQTTKTYAESTAGLYFELNSDKKSYTLVATGSCTLNEITIDGYKGLPVTKIGYRALYDNSVVTKITIGSAVTTIAEEAFYMCDNLKTVTMANNVTSIDKGAFMDCKSLETITLSSCLTSISDRTFERCSKLKNITLPKNITTIGSNAFFDCFALTSITLPENLTFIDEWAFGSAGLKSIVIPKNVKKIGAYAFGYCELESAELTVKTGWKYEGSGSAVDAYNISDNQKIAIFLSYGSSSTIVRS